MIDGTYKLTFNGYKIGEAGQVVSWSDPNAFHTITLLTDGHGSIQSTSLTGRPGDVVTLSTEYSSYYRFDKMSLVDGDGTLEGNTFTFGLVDSTICATFKVNEFTAKGLWEHGSNNSWTQKMNTQANYSIPMRYAYLTASTGDIPSSWHSTSERWNPSDASSYNIFLNPIAKVTINAQTTRATANCTFYTNLNGTNTNSQTFGGTNTYNKLITTATQGTCGITGEAHLRGYYNGSKYQSVTLTVNADSFTGTWSATGIAP